MEKPFFYYEPLKLWEEIIIAVYAALTICFFLKYQFGHIESKAGVLLLYVMGTQFCLIFGLYTSIRNFRSYLIWLFFSLLHVAMYFIFRHNPKFKFWQGNPLTSLLITVAILLLYQILRILSLKIQQREFYTPGRGYDWITGKKVSYTDYFLFGIWFLTMVTLITLSFSTKHIF